MTVSDTQNGKKALLDGIKQDADKEAKKNIQQAEQAAADRKTAAEKQVLRILGDAEKKAEEQIEEINRNTASSISVETRRISLKARNMVVRKVLDSVQEELAQMKERPEYREVLTGWIVEGSLALNTREAFVNVSINEVQHLDDSLLKDAEKKVKALTGRSINLKKSGDDPLLSQGAVITDGSNRISYNNQVQTRFLRFQSEISRMIHQELFIPEGKA